MTVQYLDLTDYLAVAAEITGLDLDTLTRVTRLSLADSALHGPAAGFGTSTCTQTSWTRPLSCSFRLAKNHPLPDGNKRAAWVSMRMFVALNGWTWVTQPDVDDAEATVLADAPNLGPADGACCA